MKPFICDNLEQQLTEMAKSSVEAFVNTRLMEFMSKARYELRDEILKNIKIHLILNTDNVMDIRIELKKGEK